MSEYKRLESYQQPIMVTPKMMEIIQSIYGNTRGFKANTLIRTDYTDAELAPESSYTSIKTDV